MEVREYTPEPNPQDIWSELDLPAEDSMLREQLTEGLPIKTLNSMVELMGVTQTSLRDALRIPPSTFLRRKKDGRFSMEESDRLYSLIEVTSRATDLFNGDRHDAVDWMNKTVPGLGHKRPIDMLDSHANTQAVLDLITRLEYGVHS